MPETKQAGMAKHEDGNGLKTDAQRLGWHVEQLHDDLTGIATDASQATRSGAAAVKRGGRRAVEFAREKGGRAAATVRGSMSRHPGATVGIAVGVGVLVGLLGPAIVRARRRAS